MTEEKGIISLRNNNNKGYALVILRESEVAVPIPLNSRPQYLNFLKPNYSSPVIHLVFFSYLRPGVLYISLQIRKAQPKWWKKGTNKQTRTWVSSKRKRTELVTLLCSSPCICRLSQTCILCETSTKPLGMLTHFLTVFSALLPSSYCLLLPTMFFSAQLSKAHCSLLPSFVNWPSLSSLRPSFSRPLPVSWEISCSCPLCRFRAKTDKEILSGTHTNRNECWPSCLTPFLVPLLSSLKTVLEYLTIL